jgi:hypothetical protein
MSKKVQIKTLNNSTQHGWAGCGLLGLDGPKLDQQPA